MSSPENNDDDKKRPAGLKTMWGKTPTAASPVNDVDDFAEEFDIDDEMLEFMNEQTETAEPAAPAPLPESKPAFLKPPTLKTKRASFTKPKASKRVVVFSIVAIALVTIFVGLIQIPAIAKSKLESKLHAAGFPQAQVNDVNLSPSSISAESVKLDQYGFDEIKSLHADIHWPAFLMSGNVEGLTITGIHLGRDAANITSGMKQFMTNLLMLPAYRISMNDATIDLTTDFGEIRISLDANVLTDQENGIRTIKARMQSSQYQLGFDTSWTGTLSKDGDLDLAAELVDGRLNIGPLRISRFNGWISTNIAAGDYSMQTNLEAGSASFMDVPLQSLSLISSYSGNSGNVIFRSGVSGMPDVMFTADLFKKEETQSFNAELGGHNLGMLLDYIEEATGHPKDIRPELIHAGPFKFRMMFEPEKRFVGGPLPFSLSLLTSGKETVNGNVLYYPDTFEVRGALETEMNMANALQNYFKIPSENMSQNFIRLDGDSRHFFSFGKVRDTQPDETSQDALPLE